MLFRRNNFLYSLKLRYSTINKVETRPSNPLELYINNYEEKKTVHHPTKTHLKCLREKFKLECFKPQQWTIISSLLYEKRDTFAIMPTGFGKSLCYQYPAVYTNSLSIVISPLISLMQDQVRFLEELNISACFLGCAQRNKSYVIGKLLENHYRILYITPETALSTFGINILQELHLKTNVSLIAVDEAHCVLQWGNSFRPVYKQLGLLRTILSSVPVLALTGTATNDQKYGIFHQLGLRNPNEIIYGLNRSNLFYLARQMTNEPYHDICRVLVNDRERMNIKDGSVIIYCLTKKKTEKIAYVLNKLGLKCTFYHSGMDTSLRKRILDEFIDGKIKVIVATTAFGMGINKENVRIIIHYGTPLTMEGYYQEVGRAGRDNDPALCVLYFSYSDFFMHRYLNKLNIKSPLSEYDAEIRNNMMKKYVSLTTCRRKFILEYFDTSSLGVHTNGCCDNCSSAQSDIESVIDVTKEAGLLLNLINYKLPETLGTKNLLAILLGTHTTYHTIHKNCEYFGKGSHKGESWWKELVFLLEIENYIKISATIMESVLYTKIELNHKGKKWIKLRNSGQVESVKINKSKILKEIEDCSDLSAIQTHNILSLS